MIEASGEFAPRGTRHDHSTQTNYADPLRRLYLTMGKSHHVTKAQRVALKEKFGGRCAYCGEVLPERGWHADHVEPVLRKSKWVNGKGFVHTGEFWNPKANREDNYFPTCRACNLDKMSSSLESWRKILEDKAGVCRRNYSCFRHAERFGLVTVTEKPIVFWFEQYDPINMKEA